VVVDQWQPAQIEQLQEIGPYLKAQREERELTLEEVAEKTRIRPGLLMALESAEVKKLPEPVYLRGFIKRYAELMGLDSDPLVARLQVSSLSPLPTASVPKIPLSSEPKRNWVKDGMGALAKLLPQQSITQQPITQQSIKLANLQARKGLAVLGILAGVGLLVGLAGIIASQNQTTQQSTGTNVTSGVEDLADVNSDSDGSEGLNQGAEALPPGIADPNSALTGTESQRSRSPNSLPLDFELEAKGASWLEVIVDGELKFEGVLQAGEERNWIVEEAVTLSAGRPDLVWISLNGNEGEPLGQVGDLNPVTYPTVEPNLDSDLGFEADLLPDN
jgi:cytoskeletal protein RodZ